LTHPARLERLSPFWSEEVHYSDTLAEHVYLGTFFDGHCLLQRRDSIHRLALGSMLPRVHFPSQRTCIIVGLLTLTTRPFVPTNDDESGIGTYGGISVTRLKPVKNHSANVLSEWQVISFLIFPLLVAAWKRRKSFTAARSGASTCLLRTRSRTASFVGNEQSFLEAILLHLCMVPAETPRQY